MKRHGLHRHLHIHKSLQRSSGVERLQRVQEVFGLPNHMVQHRAGKRHFPNSLTMLLQAMQLADELSGLLAGSAQQLFDLGQHLRRRRPVITENVAQKFVCCFSVSENTTAH